MVIYRRAITSARHLVLLPLWIFVKTVLSLRESIRSVICIFIQSCLDFLLNLSSICSMEGTISLSSSWKIWKREFIILTSDFNLSLYSGRTIKKQLNYILFQSAVRKETTNLHSYTPSYKALLYSLNCTTWKRYVNLEMIEWEETNYCVLNEKTKKY